MIRRASEILLLLPVGGCLLLAARLNPEFAPVLPRFLLFIAGFVVLPALGLGGLLLRGPLSTAERLALGAPAALALLFGLAYSAALFRLPWLIWLQPGLGAAACVAVWTGNRGTGPSEPPAWGDLWLNLGLLAAGSALLAVDFVATSAPTPQTLVDYYNDDVGQSAFVFAALRAMENGLPVWDPLVAGTKASYHLLMHFCYAAGWKITGAHPMDQIMFLWPPVLWLLLTSALVTGCRRLAGFSLLETAIAAVLLLFCGGVNFYSSPATQLFNYQHTFFLGLPALVLFCTALYGYLSGRTAGLPVSLAAISFLVCAATKAQLLLLLPLALFPVLALRAVRRRAKAAEYALAALCLCMVALLKLTLYPDTARVAMQLPKFGKLFAGTLGNLGDMLLVLGVPALFALLAAEANSALRAKLSRAGHYHLFCLGYVFVAALLLRLFNLIGADFYVFWHARVLVFLACAPAFAHCLRWRTVPRFAPAAGALLAAGIALMLQAQYLPNLFGAVSAGSPRVAADKTLDSGERQGLRWAAANLDLGATFFTNKNTYQALYLGGYHPQDMYDFLGWGGLQGHAWATRWLPDPVLRTAQERVARQQAFLDAATPESRSAAMSRLPDVDYYFHSLQRDPGFIPPDCLREVHRTPSLVIYRNLCGGESQAEQQGEHL